MAFLKHIGKLGNRKVVIVFREVPNEPHMCLVIYSETLKQSLHESLMKVVESDIGQRAESLSDALNRSYSNEGEILLHVFHKEGLLKKVQTKMVLVTPTPNSSVSLEELNKILTEMKQGEAATKRLADLDASAGMQTPSEIAKRHRPPQQPSQPVQNAPQSSQPAVFDDSAMAANLRRQSAAMQLQANQLLAESERLLKEAEELSPSKPVVTSEVVTPQPKKRGRKSPTESAQTTA